MTHQHRYRPQTGGFWFRLGLRLVGVAGRASQTREPAQLVFLVLTCRRGCSGGWLHLHCGFRWPLAPRFAGSGCGSEEDVCPADLRTLVRVEGTESDWQGRVDAGWSLAGLLSLLLLLRLLLLVLIVLRVMLRLRESWRGEAASLQHRHQLVSQFAQLVQS